MWKAAFGGRSDRDGDRDRKDTASSSGKRRHRRTDDDDAASAITSVSRRTDSSRKKRSDRDDDDRRIRGDSSGLTEGALRSLDNDEDWEDDDDETKSERRSKRSSKSRSEKDERKKEKERKERRDDDDRDKRRRSTDQKSSKRSTRADDNLETDRALPPMGSFEQFPGMYDAAVVRPPEPEHTMSGALPLDPHIPNQFPGQMPATYEHPAEMLNPHGAAADYYGDQGQSVSTQPGVRPTTPMMLHNPDTHLITPSAQAMPAQDTGNGAAAEFYSGRVTPPRYDSQPSNGPQGTPGRPSQQSGIGAGVATAATAAAIVGLAGSQSRPTPGKPNRHNSAPSFAPNGNVYDAPPAVTGKYEGNGPPTNHTGLYAAAGAAALGAAAYGMSHQGSQQASHNPQQGAYYEASGTQQHHHEHRGPIERLKDGILDMIADPDDVRKMEAYTEYIGVCKYCFDPRSSPWDGPRKHHYHPRTRDSFESLRRRASTDKLRRKSSGERIGGSSRIEKEARYAASDSSRKRQGMSKAELAGLGALGAGAVTTGAMLWKDGKDFDDTYSVKSGHRASSPRRRSRSSSRDRRRRSSYGVIGPDRQEEKWVTVKTKDGRVERRKVMARSRSRSHSRDRRSGWTGAAAGAVLGAAALSELNKRSPERKSEKVFVRRKSTRSRSRSSSPGGFFGGKSRRSPVRRESRTQEDQGLFGGFFAEPKRRDGRKKEKGFFSFSNDSASSDDAALAFGGRSSLGRKPSSQSLKSRRKLNRKTSEERVTAAVAGIGVTAAALAAAQRGHRPGKHASNVELGARRETREFVEGRKVTADDEGWEDELPSDATEASHDSNLAFGDHNRRDRMSRRSRESLASDASGGLGAWGWRWGSKKKSSKQRSDRRQQPNYPPTYQAQPPPDFDKDMRRQSSISTGPPPPMQYVDPRPLSEAGNIPQSRQASMPGAFDSYDQIQRPSIAPIQQPQPIVPISPAFTQGLNEDPLKKREASRQTPTKPKRTQSSPTRNGFGNIVGDAALVGGAAIATAGIIAAQNKRKDSTVRFGLTDEQQRKENLSREQEREREDVESRRQRDIDAARKREEEDRERQREAERQRGRDRQRRAEEDERRERERRQAEDDRRREQARQEEERRAAERAEAAKEEARRAARDADDRRVRELQQRARDAQEEAERKSRENREREAAIVAAAAGEKARRERERRQQEELARQEQIRAAEEEARFRARFEAEEAARRAANERDDRKREAFAGSDARRRQEDRDFEEEEDRERRRRDKQRSIDEEERFDTEDRHGKNSKRKSSLSRDKEASSNAWQAPVAAGVAGAITGAILDGARHKEARDARGIDNPAAQSPAEGYAAKTIVPSTEHSGAPITDDDLFDPNFFKNRKRTQSEVKRTEEIARKAAEKVIADQEEYYNTPAPSQAEFFAPKELLDRKAEEKERSTDPMGGNEVQVWHSSEAEVRDHFNHPLYAKDNYDIVRDALGRPVPRLNVIAPTPPPPKSPLQQPKKEEPTAAGAESGRESEKDESSTRRQRAVSWGQDQTHVYQVQTPDSMIDRDSYVGAHEIPHSASTPLDDEIVVEEDDEDGTSRTTRYSRDELTNDKSRAEVKPVDKSREVDEEKDVEEIDREADERAEYFADASDRKYRQPFYDSVSDLGFAVDSPGTEGAPPVRGWVEDEEVEDPTPKEEKTSILDKSSQPVQKVTEPAEQPKKSGSIFGSKFASLVGAAMGSAGAAAAVKEEEPVEATKEITDEPAWEPTLSKKDKKKRDKLAKRQSITDDIEPEVVESERAAAAASTSFEDEFSSVPLSKKEQKKRDKAAKRQSILDDFDTEPVQEDPVTAMKDTFEDDFPSTPLSKKEQKKRDKAAKRASIVEDDNFGDVKAEEEPKRQDSIDDTFYDAPLSKKEKKRREKLAKRGLSYDDDSMPSTPASESEEPLSRSRDLTEDVNRTDNKYQGVGDVVGAVLTAGGIAALANTSRHNDDKDEPSKPAEDVDDIWDTPSKKNKAGKKKKKRLGEPIDSDPRDIEPSYAADETRELADESRSSESSTTRADKRSSMPGGWDEDERREEATASESDNRPVEAATDPEAPEEDVWSGYETKKSKKNKKKRNSVFNEPAVSSPLRSEVQHEEPVSSRDLAETNGNGTSKYSNGHHEVSESPRELSPERELDDRREDNGERSDGEYALDDDRSTARRRKRRSRHEDDDAKSTTSSTTSKDKKSGIFGSIFGRKSDAVSTTSSKDSRKDEDESEQRHHRRHRTGSEYGEDDDTRSVTSSGRKHRHRDDEDEDDRRHRRHHHRDDDDPDDLRRTRQASPSEDQSFLGDRVEDLPPLPDSRPASPVSAIAREVQEPGSPVQAEVHDVGHQGETTRNEESFALEDLPPLPDTPPRSPVIHAEPSPGYRPIPVRPNNSTAVPLRFKPPPPSPSQTHSRSGSLNSPVESATTSPASTQRQKTPRGRSDVHSGEFRPLYLAERHSKPVEPIEDDLPSLPSSKPSSRASSVHESEAYHSAAEDIWASPRSQRQLRVDTDVSHHPYNEEDVLGSQQTTPRALDFEESGNETAKREEPQFYTWEDLMREEHARSMQQEQPEEPRETHHEFDEAQMRELPASRPESPVAADHKVHGAALLTGAAVLGGVAAASIAHTPSQHHEQTKEVSQVESVQDEQPRDIIHQHERSTHPEALDAAPIASETAPAQVKSLESASAETEDHNREEVIHTPQDTTIDTPRVEEDDDLPSRPLLGRKISKKAARKAKKSAKPWDDEITESPAAVSASTDQVPSEPLTTPASDAAPGSRELALESAQVDRAEVAQDKSETPLIDAPGKTAPSDPWDEPEYTIKKRKGKKGKRQSIYDSGSSTPVKTEEATEPADEYLALEDKLETGAIKHESPVPDTEFLNRAIDDERFDQAERKLEADREPRLVEEAPSDKERSTELSGAEFIQEERSLEEGSIQPTINPAILTLSKHEVETDPFLAAERALEEDASHPYIVEPAIVADVQSEQVDDLPTQQHEQKQAVTPQETHSETALAQTPQPEEPEISNTVADDEWLPTPAKKQSKKEKRKSKKAQAFNWDLDEPSQDSDVQSTEVIRDVDATREHLPAADASTAPAQSIPSEPMLEAQGHSSREITLDEPSAAVSSPRQEAKAIAPTVVDVATPEDSDFAPVKSGKKGKKAKKQKRLDLWADDEPETPAADPIVPSENVTAVVDETAQDSVNHAAPVGVAALSGEDISRAEAVSDMPRGYIEKQRSSSREAEPRTAVVDTLSDATPTTAVESRDMHSSEPSQHQHADVPMAFADDATYTHGLHQKEATREADAPLTSVAANDGTAKDTIPDVQAEATQPKQEDDDWPSFSTKKSKKDKKRGKKGVQSFAIDSESKESTDAQDSDLPENAAVAAAVATAAAGAAAASQTDITNDDFFTTSTKKSKKAGRKAKRSGYQSFDFDQDSETLRPEPVSIAETTEVPAGDRPAVHEQSREPRESPTLSAVDKHTTGVTHDQPEPSFQQRDLGLIDNTPHDAIAIALPEDDPEDFPVTAEHHNVVVDRSPEERSVNNNLESTNAGARHISRVEGEHQPTITQMSGRGSPVHDHPGQDIDFAATVAAGLQDSGFDPKLVVDDPIFHRRASPTGVAEGDPDEAISFSTRRRKKRSSGSASPVEREVEQDNTPLDSISDATQDNASRDMDVKKADDADFDAIVNRGLSESGFDSKIYEDETPAASTPAAEDDEFFVTNKRKGKKNKRRGQQSIRDLEIIQTSNARDAEPSEPRHEPISIEEPSMKLEPSEAVASHAIDVEPTIEQAPMAREPTPDEWDIPTKKKGRKGKKRAEALAYFDEPVPETVEVEPLQTDTLADTQGSGAATLLGGDREMDIDEMDKAYKAYKKNKRKAKKDKYASLTSSTDTTSTPIEDVVQEVSADPAKPVHTDRHDSSASRDNERAMKTEDKQEIQDQLQSTSPRLSRVVTHTSEVSQSLPVEVDKSPRPRAGLTEYDVLPIATGLLAGAVAGGALLTHQQGAHTGERALSPLPAEAAPSWSFSALDQEHDSTAVKHARSHERLAERRSIEPLRVDVDDKTWDISVPKQRAAQTQSEVPRSRTPSGETPLEPTSRNRASYLFQSTPEITPDAKVSSVRTTPAAESTPRGTSTFSPYLHDSASREILNTIEEESPTARKSTEGSVRSRVAQFESSKSPQPGAKRDIGAISVQPAQRDAKSRREDTFSPVRGLDRQLKSPVHHARSPSDDIGRRRISPSLADGQRRVLTDPRSPSVLSNRSNTSNGHRVPEELRSFISRASSNGSAPVLRRVNMSGDLRSASRNSSSSNKWGDVDARNSPKTTSHPPFEHPPTPPLYDEDIIEQGASRAVDMADVYQGYGDHQGSHISPTRPPSVRKRQSMHILELESRLYQLSAENRALSEARRDVSQNEATTGLRHALDQRELELREKDIELHRIRTMLGPMQAELERLSEINRDLTEANRNLVDDTNGRYATLQAEHEHAHNQWQNTTRELDNVRAQQTNLATNVRDAIVPELNAALAEKDSEIRKLREELEIATERIRALQVEIQSSKDANFLVQRDEDYFDGACQKLCQHAQQWVLRFSKTSDHRVCRMSAEINDEKIEARLDNAILDGSDVDKLLRDRVRRRDVFMSVVTTMMWEYVFTRYLFGMDREQRQKLKNLEKTLAEVGPQRAVAQWRATTLTLLCKRPQFEEQCALDTEAVAHEIFGVLCQLLPPPSNTEQQLLQSLQRVIKIAVDLSIEMNTQRAKYIMLPPLQPEYDTNGDLLRQMHFNAALMNERSGDYNSNEELEAQRAVVKLVLFPPMVKKGDDFGEGTVEIVVCPAQVLVHSDGGKGKKVVRVMSGAIEMDDPRMSRQSLVPSVMPGASII